MNDAASATGRNILKDPAAAVANFFIIRDGVKAFASPAAFKDVALREDMMNRMANGLDRAAADADRTDPAAAAAARAKARELRAVTGRIHQVREAYAARQRLAATREASANPERGRYVASGDAAANQPRVAGLSRDEPVPKIRPKESPPSSTKPTQPTSIPPGASAKAEASGVSGADPNWGYGPEVPWAPFTGGKWGYDTLPRVTISNGRVVPVPFDWRRDFYGPSNFEPRVNNQPNRPTSSPIPGSYINHSYKIDMEDAPGRSDRTALGHKRNGRWFWEQMLEQFPELFSPENARDINDDGRAPTIDDQWVKFNPTHKAFMNHKLIHHHLDQGSVATPLPKPIHEKWTKSLHPYRGERKGKKG